MIFGIVTDSEEAGAEVMAASLAVALSMLNGGRKIVGWMRGLPVDVPTALLSEGTVEEPSILVVTGETAPSLPSATVEVGATMLVPRASVDTGDAADVTVTTIVSKRVTVAMLLLDEVIALGSYTATEVDGEGEPAKTEDAVGSATTREVVDGTTVEEVGVTNSRDDVVGMAACDDVSMEVTVVGRFATVVVRMMATGGTADAAEGSARTAMNAGTA